MSQILLARSIAEEAHLGQFRRDGKTPYIEHPRQVSHRLYHLDDNYIAAAWLHDVIEDNSNFTLNSLRDRGVNEKIISAVDSITKKNGEDYDLYLSRVKGNKIAIEVKIADMLVNLSDKPTKKQIIRYAKGLLFLIEA